MFVLLGWTQTQVPWKKSVLGEGGGNHPSCGVVSGTTGCWSDGLHLLGTEGLWYRKSELQWANQASVAGTKHTSSSVTHGKILGIQTTVHRNRLPLKSGTFWFRVVEEAFLPEVDHFWGGWSLEHCVRGVKASGMSDVWSTVLEEWSYTMEGCGRRGRSWLPAWALV